MERGATIECKRTLLCNATLNNSNVRHGYVLATWLQRLAAHLIDRLIVWGIFTVGILGLTAAVIDTIFDDYDITSEEEWVPVLSSAVGGRVGVVAVLRCRRCAARLRRVVLIYP